MPRTAVIGDGGGCSGVGGCSYVEGLSGMSLDMDDLLPFRFKVGGLVFTGN